MKLAVFKLQLRDYRDIIEWVGKIYDNCLKDDGMWYFMPSPPREVLLRISTGKQGDVKRFCKKEQLPYEQMLDFEPNKDEYRRVCVFGDALTAMFHQTSLIALHYPQELAKHIIERSFHIFLFQVGIFDWQKEAKMLADLALNRAMLYGRYGWRQIEYVGEE